MRNYFTQPTHNMRPSETNAGIEYARPQRHQTHACTIWLCVRVISFRVYSRFFFVRSYVSLVTSMVAFVQPVCVIWLLRLFNDYNVSKLASRNSIRRSCATATCAYSGVCVACYRTKIINTHLDVRSVFCVPLWSWIRVVNSDGRCQRQRREAFAL